MLSCAFFGHRDLNYTFFAKRIEKIIVDLIESGVTEFYHGNRGRFEGTCADILIKLREKYPQIKHILVLSYAPDENFVVPFGFDEAVYLQDINTPKKFAISYTNRKLVEKADFVVVANIRNHGGTKAVYDYAKRLLKSRINILTNESEFFYEPIMSQEMKKFLQEHYERFTNDDEYRKAQEENCKKILEIAKPIFEKEMKKYKKKKAKEKQPTVWITVTKTTED